jgi:hypothetical protein
LRAGAECQTFASLLNSKKLPPTKINCFVADAILFNMLTNEFWYGFLLGAGLVFLVFFVSRLIIRKREEGR